MPRKAPQGTPLFPFGTEQYGVTTGTVARAARIAQSLGCVSIALAEPGLLQMWQYRTGQCFQRRFEGRIDEQ